jgi:hypothetical protein
MPAVTSPVPARALTENSVLARNAQVTVQSLGPGEGGVALRLDTGEMYTLNDTSLDFLARLDGTKTLAAITEEMLATFDVDRVTLVADLIEVAQGLRDEGLVTVS